MITMDEPRTGATVSGRPAAPRHWSRTRLLGWSVAGMITWPVATVLFCVWVTVAALSPLTLFIPVLVALTPAVRRYIGLHRRWTSRMLGEPLPAPYRSAQPGQFGRARTILTDRSTWRDAVWLLVHSTVGAILWTLSFALFAGGVFYLIFPFLYSITPADVFSQPFGFFTLDSLAESFALVPLSLAAFGLWFATVRPITLAQARLNRALLR